MRLEGYERKTLTACLWVLLCVLAVFLFLCHYVKAYSDPVGWLERAVKMAEGNPITSRAPVYPMFLAGALQLLGSVWIWLVNLPLVLLMVFLTCRAVTSSLQKTSRLMPGLSMYSGFAAAWILVWRNYSFFRELVNPFREALAFVLLIVCITLVAVYLLRRGWWRLSLGGLMLGLSVGTRETSVVALPALFVLLVYESIRDRSFPWLRAILLFGAGLIVGMTPFFVQNHLESGRFWLPSYAAEKLDRETGPPQGRSKYVQEAVKEAESLAKEKTFRLPRDIPIPGMSFAYFVPQGKKTARFLYRKYEWWGWTAFALGALLCLRLGHTRFLILFGGNALTFALFYSCFYYVKERYLFAVDIFAVPVMGLGLAGAVALPAMVAQRLKKGLGGVFRVSVFAALTLLASFFMIRACFSSEERLKVWQIPKVRELICPQLDKNPIVVSSNAHLKDMIHWLLGIDGLPSGYVNEIDIDAACKEGMDIALSKKGGDVLDKVRSFSVYSVGHNMLRNWCDFSPLIGLDRTGFPIDHYGKPVDEILFRVRPWSRTNVHKRISIVPDVERHLLHADLFRIWDYPGRKNCRLVVDGATVADRMENGVNLIPIATPGGDSVCRLDIISDQPLPAEPEIRAYPLNAAITFHTDLLNGVFRPGGDFVNDNSMAAGSWRLFNSAFAELPKFADSNTLVYAQFRVVAYREDPAFAGGRFSMRLESPFGKVTKALPKRRSAEWIGVPLGVGNGSLEMIPVTLETSLPSYADQCVMWLHLEARDLTYARIPEVRIMTMPAAMQDSEFFLDIGSAADDAFILDGFYGKERTTGNTSVRWSGREGVVLIPRIRERGRAEFRIRCVDMRPEEVKEAPVFVLDGDRIPAEKVDVIRQEDRFLEYVFSVEARPLRHGIMDTLSIVSEPWVPKELTASSDERELGCMVDSIKVVQETQ